MVVLIIGCLFVGSLCQSRANDIPSSFTQWQQNWRHHVSETWRSRDWTLFAPLRIWHNRACYTAEEISNFNEAPWGIGFGKAFLDEKQNRHSLFVMGFQDSHNDFEPVAGYMWQKLWRNDADTFRFSLGFMAGLTARADMDYIPLPMALPVIGLEYKHLAIEFTYIPPVDALDIGGNTIFVWAAWRL